MSITAKSMIHGLVFLLLAASPSLAASGLDTGDTAWVTAATALVLLMTLPGLALFYAGLVQPRNVLSVLMHCFAIACLSSIVWFVLGYSLAFGEVGHGWWGGFEHAFLAGIGLETLLGTIPENLFAVFQMTFAIITPALVVGAFVERARFLPVLLFSGFWLLLVYAPVTHWVWGGGFLSQMGVRDFAGGIVVHATAGMAALVFALMLGPRRNFPHGLQPPHSPILTMIGASMLWVGWFGFNGGSALAANGDAGMAILVTHISAATATIVWIVIEKVKFGKSSLVGAVTGCIAGLASITPASGSVGPMGGLVIGLIAGVVCYYMVNVVKDNFKIDDSLDVFAVHGIGGLLGILLIPFLTSESYGGIGYDEGSSFSDLMTTQIIGAVSVGLFTLIGSVILLLITKSIFGLRVTDDSQEEGLDIAEHGQSGYKL
ncbi:MAG TPA: ammonia channel protein [Alphaproteobacteria bacterium]|nr:ammonia channel protein [Alphaproteobacteria bacterium]